MSGMHEYLKPKLEAGLTENGRLRMANSACTDLLAAVDPFARVLRIIDALPEGYKIKDGTPLIAALPGGWPTLGELRRLVGLIEAANG